MMNDSTIKIKAETQISADQLHQLYNSVGWSIYTTDPIGPRLQTAIRNSTYIVTAWDSNRLVGLARGLSDDVSIFYLQDILVNPDYQGQGIGKRLLKNCLTRFQHVRMKVLLTDDSEQQLAFYESLGYRNINELKKERLNVFVQIKGIYPD
jgi:ribosomal protein S18 acetylase RimI-like enzyme